MNRRAKLLDESECLAYTLGMTYDPRFNGPDREQERAEYEAWSAEIQRQADEERFLADEIEAMEEQGFLAEVAAMVFVPGLGWS